jgi:hypothetical protein
MFIHCCHCTDCQVQTGGAFAINAIIERDRIEIAQGAPVTVSLPTDSGRPHDVTKCPRCQTALWSDYGRRGVLVFVRVSTLEDRHALVPDVHIFTRSKVPWVELPGKDAVGSTTGKPPGVFEVYYDMAKEWPAQSLARRAAVLGAGK